MLQTANHQTLHPNDVEQSALRVTYPVSTTSVIHKALQDAYLRDCHLFTQIPVDVIMHLENNLI
jgi:hypothetical protein